MSEQRPFEVGDEVYMFERGRISRVKVVRVTKTQALIESGARFRHIDGFEVGVGSRNPHRIMHPTPELDRQWSRHCLLEAARNLKRLIFEGTPSEIRAAYAAWDGLEKEVNGE